MMRITRHTLLFAGMLALCLVLSGCGERGDSASPESPEASDQHESRTGDLLAQRSDLDSREVAWSEGDVATRARGYFRGERLVYIDEHMDRGEYGSTREEYLLHDNRLIHFRRTGRMLSHDDDQRAFLQDVETEVLFNLDGTPRVVQNLAGDIDRDLDTSEVHAIMAHFERLRARLTGS